MRDALVIGVVATIATVGVIAVSMKAPEQRAEGKPSAFRVIAVVKVQPAPMLADIRPWLAADLGKLFVPDSFLSFRRGI